MPEKMLQGWAEIAEVLRITPRYASVFEPVLREEGRIFDRFFGKPPKRWVCSYESLLQAFLVRHNGLPKLLELKEKKKV